MIVVEVVVVAVMVVVTFMAGDLFGQLCTILDKYFHDVYFNLLTIACVQLLVMSVFIVWLDTDHCVVG